MGFSLKFLSVMAAIVLASGCATMGGPFQFPGPRALEVGATTQSEIRDLMGEPFRVGYDNGDTQWTYGHYKYSVFGDNETKDLVLTFNRNKTLKNYVYSTSMKDEKKRLLKKN